MNKRTNILVVAFCLCLTMWAQPKNAIVTINSAIDEFLGSGQLLTKDTHWSHAMGQWHFKLTVEGDSLSEPAALQKLKAAFTECVPQATAVYFHDVDRGPSLLDGLYFVRKDNYYSNITGQYVIKKDYNFRILSIADMGVETYYGLEWHVFPFCDRNGKKFSTMEGVLYKFTDGAWRMESFKQESWPQSTALPFGEGNQLKYEILKAQISHLRELTDSKAGVQADLRLYLITRLLDGIHFQLSEHQFSEILSLIPQFTAAEMTAERQRILSNAVDRLERRCRFLPSAVFREVRTNNAVFLNPENEQVLDFQYDISAEHQRSVTVNVSGTASGQLMVSPRFPAMHSFDVLLDNGNFTLKEKLFIDQLYEIRDHSGHSLMLFADSVPTVVDLSEMRVVGSSLNERFAETQRRMKTMERDLQKYMIRDSEILMDVEGYQKFLADVHEMQIQLIKENMDNLIPVWFLSEYFSSMSLSELSQYLRPELPYTRHLSLQPVWKYYEGLEKRQPGKMFADAECVDTAGVSHRLSEYIGRGDYVVLQFWEARNWTAHAGCKYMKMMAKEYRGKGIRFIGLSLDTNKADWKRYIKKRDLCYEHLTVASTDNTDRWKSEVIQAYGIMALPESIVFSPDGRIISCGLGGESLLRFVSKLNPK